MAEQRSYMNRACLFAMQALGKEGLAAVASLLGMSVTGITTTQKWKFSSRSPRLHGWRALYCFKERLLLCILPLEEGD